MEELTLRYYLKLFSITSLFVIIVYFFFIFFFDSILLKNNIIKINKGDSSEKIVNLFFEDKNIIQKKIYYYVFKLYNLYYLQINYGKFYIKENANFFTVIQTVSQKSNLDYNITIIEGSEKYNLNNYLKNFYYENANISYHNLLADTYKINSSNSIKDLKNFLFLEKEKFLKKYNQNEFLKKNTLEEIFIIASLIEKEAKNTEDKKNIASVIFNRLELNMRLQIDATVIYALTEGKKKLNRKLTYKDLNIQHPYNTYKIDGLPPGMICYVSLETIKIALENPKSDYLFYFYNILEKRHIYSKNFNDHKDKLNEYRKKIK